EDAAQQEDELGETRMLAVCSSCHEADRVYESGRRTLGEWKDVVERMIALGSDAAPTDAALITKYLAHTFGMANVNRALAPELAEVLRISQAEADAIVDYRKGIGKFADFAALSKVPGINVSKLEQSVESLNFR
ncbi:MAG: helix-hairpin-helix domain-containing protein, partial [Acidobacteriota bacterium]